MTMDFNLAADALAADAEQDRRDARAYRAQQSWPEGVIARYLTVAGQALADPTLAVEVRGNATSRCVGCGESDYDDRFVSSANTESRARRWAQKHAEKCRAMPKPGGE